MTKKIFLIAVLVSLFRFAGAEETEFEPLISEDKVWEYVLYDGSNYFNDPILTHYYATFNGRTMRNGKEYRNFYMNTVLDSLTASEEKPVAYLREEDGEVFMLRSSEHLNCDFIHDDAFKLFYVYGDTLTEFKIYDFNLKPGESFNFVSPELFDKYENINHEEYWSTNPFPGIDVSIRLDSINIGIFEGIERKVQHISLLGCFGGNGTYRFHVIEGLGIQDGGFIFCPYMWDDRTLIGASSLDLESVREKPDKLLFKSHIYDVFAIESVSADETARISVKGDELAVEATGKWTLTIYNVSGLTVATHTGTDFGSIDVTPLPSGIYIARLQTAIGTKSIKFAR